jgi:hypothetical protein
MPADHETEEIMARFVLGMAVGLALGLGGTAMAANIVGGDSFLSGWDVVKNGEVVCKDPWAVTANKLIDCKGQ